MNLKKFKESWSKYPWNICMKYKKNPYCMEDVTKFVHPSKQIKLSWLLYSEYAVCILRSITLIRSPVLLLKG